MIKRMKEGKPLFGDEDAGIVEDEQVFTSKTIPELDPSDNHKDIHSNQEREAIKRAVRLTNNDIDKLKVIESEDIDKLKVIDNNPKKETKIRERYIEEELI
jgi:hypothetical protein